MKRPARTSPRRAFTLIELLCASAMFALLLAALYAVFFSTLDLRKRAGETIDRSLPARSAAEILRRDLESMMRPDGVLASAILGVEDEEGAARRDTLEFASASGAISSTEPWGDLRKIHYSMDGDAVDSGPAGLGSATAGSAARPTPTPTTDADAAQVADAAEIDGTQLVRQVTRNLLARESETPPPEILLEKVDSLAFAYYDGQSWQDSWDSTALENAAPQAVRVRVDFQAPADGQPPEPPLEIVVPIPMQPAAVADETSSEGTGS